MKQRIIIIGGMGPQASLELHRRIIRRASANGARDGTDFPYIVHLSLPVPDFITNESHHLLGCDHHVLAPRRRHHRLHHPHDGRGRYRRSHPGGWRVP